MAKKTLSLSRVDSLPIEYVKIGKTGGSTTLTIPKKFVGALGLVDGGICAVGLFSSGRQTELHLVPVAQQEIPFGHFAPSSSANTQKRKARK